MLSVSATRDELRLAVRQLSERGLRCSSKWAAEQLIGLQPAAATASSEDHEMAGTSSDELVQEEESEHEQDLVLLAKAYFDSNEFLRAAHTLRNAQAARGRFLRWYSLFLAGEKRKDEEAMEESNIAVTTAPTAKPRAVNEQLSTLHAELAPQAAAGRLDGYGFYVFALTLRELHRTGEMSANASPTCSSSAIAPTSPTLWAQPQRPRAQC